VAGFQPDDVNPTEILVDFNHPLAGETLHFVVTVAAVREATPQEIAHGHPHHEGCEHECEDECEEEEEDEEEDEHEEEEKEKV